MKSNRVEQKKTLDKLRSYSGNSTELVSLYISKEDNLNDYKSRMRSEVSEAENIKSKSTRKNVKSALKSISKALGNYKQTPKNGIIVFSSSEELFIFDDLPQPVRSSIYKCDSSFYVEPLENILRDSKTYGLLVITENKSTIGVMNGNRIEEKKTIESGLHGKHKAGGQSAQRFSRDRKQKKKKYFREVGESIKKLLDTKELVLGGVNITLKSFKRDNNLPHNINVVAQANVDHAGKSGLRELAGKTKETLSEKKLNEERELLEEFYKSLRDGKDAYGKETVKKYIDHGRVEKLILSEKTEEENLVEKTKQNGGEVVYISTEFEEGKRFYNNFNGIGAILRW